MSDIQLKASIDFSDVPRQVDAVVGEIKKKFSDIKIQANAKGGSLSGGLGQNVFQNAMRQMDSLTRAYEESARKRERLENAMQARWEALLQRRERAEQQATARQDRAAQEATRSAERAASNRLRLMLRSAEMAGRLYEQEAAAKLRAERKEFDSTLKMLEQQAAAEIKAQADRTRAVEKAENTRFRIMLRSAEMTGRQAEAAAKAKMQAERKDYDATLKMMEQQVSAEAKAQAERTRLAEREAKKRTEAERRDWDATIKMQEMAVASQLKLNERLAKAAQLAAKKQVSNQIVDEKSVGRADIQAQRLLRQIGSQVSDNKYIQSDLIDKTEVALEKYTNVVKQYGARSLEAAKANLELQKSFAGVAEEIKNYKRQEKALKDQERADAAAIRSEIADIRSIGAAENRALGLQRRIDRQLSRNPSLQSDLSAQTEAALRKYTDTVRQFGSRSLEATRAHVELQRSFTSINAEIAKSGGLLAVMNKGFGDASIGGQKLSRFLLNTQVALSALMGAFGMREIIKTSQEIETFTNTLKAVSPDAKAAAENVEFLKKAGDAVGFSYKEMGTTFAQFAAAGYQAGAATDAIQQAFVRVTAAARNFGLSNEQTEGTIKALTQSMSKGTFQAEEVRQQLGDRLPVAMAALAKATGVSSDKLMDMMKKGELSTSKYMVPFVNALFEASGGMDALSRSSMSITANLGRVSNAFTDLIDNAGKNGLYAVINTALSGLTNFLRGDAASAGMELLKSGLSEVTKVFNGLASALNTTAPLFRLVASNLDLVTAAAAGFAALKVGEMFIVAARGVAVFTASLAANPVTLFATAVSAAIAALIYFGDSQVKIAGASVRVWDVFKGTITSAFKTVGNVLADLIDGGAGLVDSFNTYFGALDTIVLTHLTDIAGNLNAFITNIENSVKAMFGNLQVIGTAVGQAMKAGWESLWDLDPQAARQRSAEAFVKTIKEGWQEAPKVLYQSQSGGKIDEALARNATTAARTYVKSFTDTLRSDNAGVTGEILKSNQEWTEAQKQAGNTVNDTRNALQGLIKELSGPFGKAVGGSKEDTKAAEKALKSFNKELEQAQNLVGKHAAQMGSDAVEAQYKYTKAMEELQDKMSKAKLTTEQYAEAQKTLNALKTAGEEAAREAQLKVDFDIAKMKAELEVNKEQAKGYSAQAEQLELLIKHQTRLKQIRELADRQFGTNPTNQAEKDAFVERFRKAAVQTLEFEKGMKKAEAELEGPMGKAFKSFAIGLEDSIKDAFADGFSAGGNFGEKMLNGFKKSFTRMLADLAYESLMRPIMVQVMGAVGTGIFGLSSQATASALGLQNAQSSGGLTGSLTNFGIGKAVSWGADQLGLGGSISSLMNTPIFGGVGSAYVAPTVTLSNGTVVAASPAVQASQQGMLATANGGATLGGILGAAGAGSLGGMLGGWWGTKTNSKAVGGLSGAVAGAGAGYLSTVIGLSSLTGPLGAAVGAIVGGVMGLLGTQKKTVGPNASGNVFLDGRGGFKSGPSAADNGGNVGAVTSVTDALSQALGTIIKGVGGTVKGPTDLNLGAIEHFEKDNKWIYRPADKGALTGEKLEFSSQEEAIQAYIRGSLRRMNNSGVLTGLDADVKTALENSKAKTAEDLANDLDFAAKFKDSVKAMTDALGIEDTARKQGTETAKTLAQQITDFRSKAAELGLDVAKANQATRQWIDTLIAGTEPKTYTETEAAVATLRAQWESMVPVLTAVGYSAEEAGQKVKEGLKNNLDRLAQDYVKNLDAEINTASGKDYLNQITSAQERRDNIARDLTALGLDTSKATAWFNATVSNILNGLTDDQMQDVVAKFGTELANLRSVVTDTSEAIRKASEKLRAEEDLRIRALRGEGKASEADLSEKLFQQRRELEEAEAAGYGEAYVAGMRYVQSLELVAFKQEQAAKQAENLASLQARIMKLQGQTAQSALTTFDLNAISEVRNAQANGLDLDTLLRTLSAERSQTIFESARQDYLEAIDRQIKALQDANSAIEENNGQLLSLRKALLDAADAALTDPNLSPLTPYQRLEEARQQFEDAYATFSDSSLSQDDRYAAGQKLQGLGQTLMEAAKTYFGSSDRSDFDRVQEVWRSIGADASDQLTTAERTLAANNQQIKELQRARESAEQLGQRQLGALSDLKASMDTAFGAMVTTINQMRPVDNSGVFGSLLSGVTSKSGLDSVLSYARSTNNTSLIKQTLERSNQLGLYYGNYAYAGPSVSFQWDDAATQAALGFLSTLGYSGAYDVNANIFLQTYGKGQDFTNWVTQYSQQRWDAMSPEQKYLSRYTDVAAAGVDPKTHYVLAGADEGRDSFGMEFTRDQQYLLRYRDVAAAVARGEISSGWDHFDRFGRAEGRAYKNGGIVGAFANGGVIGNGIWNVDSVIAAYAGGGNIALAGGEFVMPAPQTQQYIDDLNAMRAGVYTSSNDNQELVDEIRELRQQNATLTKQLIAVTAASGEANIEGHAKTTAAIQQNRDLQRAA